MSDRYKFQFDATDATVLTKLEVERNKSKAQKITGSTFELTSGLNDLGATAVVSVTETRLSKGFVETSLFVDQDGNGLFEKSFEIEVTTGAAAARNLEMHRFSFDVSGRVTADYELKKSSWKLDRIDLGESFSQASLDEVGYVVKTEHSRDGIEFELFRDDNLDGVWTQVAEGHVGLGGLDPATGSIDLIGIQSYLEASAAVIG